MTNGQSALSDLERLTSPAEAKKEEEARNRSSFRPPFTSCTCDFGPLTGPYETTTTYGSDTRTEQKVSLKLLNMRNVKGVTPFDGTDFDLELKVPAKPNVNSEATLMVASAQALNPDLSIVKFSGLKGVTLEEKVHYFKGRKNTNKKDATGRDIWEDSDFETRYYAITSIGSTSKPAVAVELPEVLVDAALDYLNGKTAAEFIAGVMQDEAVQVAGTPEQRAALGTQAIKGTFIATAVENGAVAIDADGRYARQMLLPVS
jgi:hypothetical protein